MIVVHLAGFDLAGLVGSVAQMIVVDLVGFDLAGLVGSADPVAVFALAALVISQLPLYWL